MGFLWFSIVAVMIATYVVFDGFDIGVGILYPLLAKSDSDRRTMLNTIGPVWDGNEVWLLAGGGTLFFAFPLLYASAFSGFYLPLIVVLWLLMLRGLGIELRSHMDNYVWRTFFDALFFISSALLAIFFGAALANVVRGVPLGADHYFFLPFWTNWNIGPHPGILDWYTVIGGLVAAISLAMHGALYIALKTEDELEARARAAVHTLWFALLGITLISLAATIYVRPTTLNNYTAFPFLFIIPTLVIASLLGMWFFTRAHQPLRAFLCSCLYLVVMLVGACAALYPTVLPSSGDPSLALNITNSIAGNHALTIGLIWWAIGMLLAGIYFFTVYRMFRGKVSAATDYGH